MDTWTLIICLNVFMICVLDIINAGKTKQVENIN